MKKRAGEFEFLVHGVPDYVVRSPKIDFATNDSVDFSIHFRPHVTLPVAWPVHVDIYHGGRHIFGQTIAVTEGKSLVLRNEELEYELYETYQLKVSNKRRTIETMYLTIENVNTNPRADMVLVPRVDTKMTLLPSLVGARAQFLTWFPPDVDPALYALKVDPRTVPQKCPLWPRLRGELTGSKTYILLGFFVPPKPTPYKFGAFVEFDPKTRARMRLGSLSEDHVMMMYLHVYSCKLFFEMGYCPAPPPPAYPAGWGASPDAMIGDPDMTWDKVPEDVASQYSETERDSIDITRGAGEFKTSETSLEMMAYYYSQCYLEMISLNVVWCDLVKFRRRKCMDPTSKRVKYENSARVYRIYRHKATERLLIKLWKYALSNRDRLQDVVMEDGFVKIRDYFERMAAQHEYTPMDMSPGLEEAYEQYEAYMTECTTPKRCTSRREVEEGGGDDELCHRATKIARCEDRGLKTQLIAQQIEGYATLLKKLV